jgi:hypothetical protein
MIRLFPSVTETLVLPMDSMEVANRVRRAIADGALNGNVTDNRFTIAPRQIRPHPFSPVVKGVIERSSRGTVVFLRYELLPSMRASLWFWFFVMMAGSTGAAYESGTWWFLGVGVMMSAVVRWIALSNQHLHIPAARKGLMMNLQP